MEKKYMSINELPFPIRDYMEYLSEDNPEYIDYIEGYYEDSYNGVAYQAVTVGLNGGIYCIDLASRYMDCEEFFFNWIDNHSKEVEIEFIYTSKGIKVYSDKYILGATKPFECDPWKVYIGKNIGNTYTAIKVNGKKKGFRQEGDILLLDK